MMAISLKTNFEAVAECALPYDDWNHGVHVTTDERGTEEVLNGLAKKPATGNTVLGVGGFYSLNIAAVRGSHIDTILIVDRSVRAKTFWEGIESIIKSSSYEKIGEKIETFLKENKKVFFSGQQGMTPHHIFKLECKAFRGDIKSGNSWLSTPEKFSFIKNIFISERFAFKRINLFNMPNCKPFVEALKVSNLTVDTYYLSNVLTYAEEGVEGDVERYALRIFEKQVLPRGSYLVPATVVEDSNGKYLTQNLLTAL